MAVFVVSAALLVQAAGTETLITNEYGETAHASAVQEVEEPKEKPKAKPEAEPKPTWKDNPNNCDTRTQYIRKDNLKCIDKPVKTPTPPNKARAVGCEHYRHLVERYNWNVSTMMYAMSKESGCNPNAVGDQYVIGGIYAPSCGLTQVRALPGRPSCEALKDPVTNIATAYQIWQGQGYCAWTVLHGTSACKR